MDNPLIDDVEYGDIACPKCGSYNTRWQRCDQCEDGYINRYDEDPLWYDEDDCSVCEECRGHGCHSWCVNCGFDILQGKYLNGKAENAPV